MSERLIEIDGEQMRLCDYIREYGAPGVTKQVVYKREKLGWDLELAIITPRREYRKRAKDGLDREQRGENAGQETH